MTGIWFLLFILSFPAFSQQKKVLKRDVSFKAGPNLLEVIEVKLDGLVIPFEKPFDASDDWVFQAEFVVKNVSSYKIKNAVIAIDFWNANPFLQYVASFNQDSQCDLLKISDFSLGPGETITMKGRFPQGGSEKWKERVSQLSVDLNQMRLYWVGVLLDDGRRWVSGHFLTEKK